MKILSFDTLPSTQLYLKQLLQQEEKPALPLAVVADLQTEGVGSRNNSWSSQRGNLFLSFAVKISSLPSDLKLESASIYFSYLLKEVLEEFGSKAYVKWPNDIYVENDKVAGMITNIVGDTLICGVGLNLVKTRNGFSGLDIVVEKKAILHAFLKKIEKKYLWKQVFSKYKLNFQTNQNIFAHIHGKKISLSKAVLEDDGSLNINGERIYSLR